MNTDIYTPVYSTPLSDSVRIRALEDDLRLLRIALKAEEQARLADRAVLDGFTGMPFWARLLWLFRVR